MIRGFLEKLCDELSIAPIPKQSDNKTTLFSLGTEIAISLSELEPGVAMRATLAVCPMLRREDLFIYLMRANLLGQGTGGAVIGLDENEKNLTLTQNLPYEINYQTFKETLEEFVNHLIYWRNELTKFLQET